MKRPMDDRIIALLFIVVCVQAYLVFFKNPVALVRQENEAVLLQRGERPNQGMGEGREGQQPSSMHVVNGAPLAAQEAQPGVIPSMQPGVPPGVQPSVQPGVPPVSQVPGKAAQPSQPGAAGAPSPAAGSPPKDDPYRNWLLGIAYIEKSGEQPLSPQQAKVVLDFLRAAEASKNAVPDAQKAILSTLNSAQKDFIRQRIQEQRSKGVPPPPPAKLDELIAQVLGHLDKNRR